MFCLCGKDAWHDLPHFRSLVHPFGEFDGVNPAARLQAAIDLLDKIIAAARDQGGSADTIIARWFGERRYAGSKDRRAIRALVYDAIRMLGERPESGRAAMLALVRRQPELAALFDGSPYGPASIAPDEPVAAAGVLPAWLAEAFALSGLDADEQAALLERAPLDIRVNTLKADPAAIQAEIPGAVPLPCLSAGLRVPLSSSCPPIRRAGSKCRTPAASSSAWRRGWSAGSTSSTCVPAAAARPSHWPQRWRTMVRSSPAISIARGFRG